MASTTKILLNKFTKLDSQIKRKEGEVEDLKKQLIPIHDELLKRFQQEGTASLKTATGTTVFIRRELWASGSVEDRSVVCTVLKAHPETKDIVKENYNTQTLSSWVREKIEECFGSEQTKKNEAELLQALPQSLQAVLKITEKFSLRARRS